MQLPQPVVRQTQYGEHTLYAVHPGMVSINTDEGEFTFRHEEFPVHERVVMRYRRPLVFEELILYHGRGEDGVTTRRVVRDPITRLTSTTPHLIHLIDEIPLFFYDLFERNEVQHLQPMLEEFYVRQLQ